VLSGSNLSVVFFFFFFVTTIPVLLVLLFFPPIEVVAIILCSFLLYYFSCLNFALVSWLFILFPNFFFSFPFASFHSIKKKVLYDSRGMGEVSVWRVRANYGRPLRYVILESLSSS